MRSAWLEQRLQVHLPRVDDVVDALRVAERRRVGVAVAGRRRPERPAVGLRREAAIAEIAAEQAELPELVGDVLADVGDDAVRADDDFLARFVVVWLARRPVGVAFFDRITQQPASLPSVCRNTAPCAFRISNACAQNCSRRMSPS